MPSTIKYSIDADPQKFFAAINKSIAKLEELNSKTRKVNRTGKKSTKIFDSMFGGLGRIAGTAIGLGAVVQQMSKINQEAKAGAAALDQELDIRKKLAQIGVKPPFVHEIAASSGLTFEKAGNVVFTALSAGFSRAEVRDLTPGLSKIVTDPSELFGTVQKLKTQFGAEAGTSREILNKVLKAAQSSPEGFQELAPEAVKAAAALQSIGGTQEELLAAASLVAEGEEAARAMTGVRTLAGEIAKRRPDLRGKGLLESIRILREEHTVDGQLDVQSLSLSIQEKKAQASGVLLALNYERLVARHEGIVAAGALTGTAQSPTNVAQRAADADPVLRVKRRSAMVKAEAVARTQLDDLREQAEQDVLTMFRARRRQIFAELPRGQRALVSAGSGADDFLLGVQDVGNVGPLSLAASAAEILRAPAGGFGFLNNPEAEQNFLADAQVIIQDFREAISSFRRAVPTVINPGEAE